MHTSCLIVFCNDMSHEIVYWELLELCVMKIKLYYESRNMGLIIWCMKRKFWVIKEININCAKWPLCWMSSCDLCWHFDKLEMIWR